MAIILPSIRKSLILIAEDDFSSYLVLEAFLKKFDVTVLHASNGREAIEMVRRNQDIDLVLMDIQLPQVDGYAATREIKSIRKNLPVIAQTAHALEDDKIKSIEAGCDDYIPKPIMREALYKLLHKYLSA